MVYLDIDYPAGQEIKSDGEAVYKMSTEMKDFMVKIEEGYKIIGVDYIHGGNSIGFILQKKEENKPSLIIRK